MSILSDALHDLRSLLFPALCRGCGALLEAEMRWVCARCHSAMPSTDYHLMPSNPMIDRIHTDCPWVESAAAQFFFINNGSWRNLIHAIKYKKAWYLGYKLGRWYGSDLAESSAYQDIDLILPIPLHFVRHIKRGYNQSELICEGIGKELKVKVDRSNLVRIRNNKSQVSQVKRNRWENVEGIFAVRHPERLAGKHIMLVDDVFTTGSTIISSLQTLKMAVPSIRVSVVTLAISQSEVSPTQRLPVSVFPPQEIV